MKSFDINRFGRTLRWVLAVNYRTLMMWFAGTFTAVLMGEMLLNMINRPGDPHSMLHIYSTAGSFLIFVATLILIGSVVASINEKRKRTRFLMLPSTNVEKYLALIVYTAVVSVVGVFLAMVLGDSVRMLYYWVKEACGFIPEYYVRSKEFDNHVYYWYSSAVPQVLKNVSFYNEQFDYGMKPTMYWIMENTLTYTFVVWLFSLYTLGGTLLRKYSFVITCLVLLLCVIVFANLQDYYEWTFLEHRWIENADKKGMHCVYTEIGTVPYVLSILFTLLTVFNYWASYRIFKGFQIITNKWTNYDILKR